ncbi:MAG TPA: hypothetical protein VFO60_09975 [Candidatus Dormibacteraeota bacterium]|nr:hypothetical protein [Candidatus Dormibacteraeota bacterium]
MNLFSGMSDHEVISTILDFALFNAFVALEAIALAAFYVTSRPRRGRVLTASLWHVAAASVFLMCFVSTVWSAPAEKSFINSAVGDEPFFDLSDARVQKVVIGLVMAAVGVALMVVGAVHARAQRRARAQEALLAG